MALLAILDDGHTGIYAPDPDTPLQIPFGILPLKFYRFEEGVYITDGIDAAADFAGFRVVRFGNLSADDTMHRMSMYRGVDNAMTWNWEDAVIREDDDTLDHDSRVGDFVSYGC